MSRSAKQFDLDALESRILLSDGGLLSPPAFELADSNNNTETQSVFVSPSSTEDLSVGAQQDEAEGSVVTDVFEGMHETPLLPVDDGNSNEINRPITNTQGIAADSASIAVQFFPTSATATMPADSLISGPAIGAGESIADQLTETLNNANGPPATLFEPVHDRNITPNNSSTAEFLLVTAAPVVPLDVALQNVLRDSAKIQNGVNGINALDGIIAKTLNHPFPLVGSGLSGAIGLTNTHDDFKKVGAAFASASSQWKQDASITLEDVRNALEDAFSGIMDAVNTAEICELDFEDVNGDGIDEGILYFNIAVEDTLISGNFQPDFDTGLPGLDLDLTGPVTVEATYKLMLRMGLSSDGQMWIDTSATGDNAELRITLEFSIAGFGGSGTLADMLMLTATDNPANPSLFAGTIKVDLKDPDNRVMLPGERNNIGYDAFLTGSTALHLLFDIKFDGGSDTVTSYFPYLTANFDLVWNFQNAAIKPDTMDIAGFGGRPQVSIGPVRMQLRSFFNELLLPMLNKVEATISPIKPFFELLSMRIPILSDLGPLKDYHDADDDGKVTMAEWMYGNDRDNPVPFLLLLVENLSEIVSSPPNNVGQVYVELGSFTFDVDLRSVVNLQTLGDTNLKVTEPTTAVFDQFRQQDPGLGLFVDKIQQMHFSGNNGEVGLMFPIFEDPQAIAKLFCGKIVDLVQFVTPEMNLQIDLAEFYIPIIWPLDIHFSGYIEAKMQLTCGFDTKGLNFFVQSADRDSTLLFDGFYIIDRHAADGTDVPELKFYGEYVAEAELNVIVFAAGVGGGIFANISIDLNDTNNDGRLRGKEMMTVIEEKGPSCLYDTTGDLHLGLYAFVKIGLDIPFVGFIGWQDRFDIASTTLKNFNSGCDGDPSKTITLATMVNADDMNRPDLIFTSGVLRLNMGPWAAERRRGDLTDMDEVFQIDHVSTEPDGTETVFVTAFGQSQKFAGVRKIYAEGGGGSDSSFFYQDVASPNDAILVSKDVISDVELWGDFNPALHPGREADYGDDVLTGGSGRAVIHGGDGHDTIMAQNTGATLYGGPGCDILFGSEGADYLYGGGGHDVIYGLGGNDEIHADTGDDSPLTTGIERIYRVPGDDYIDGGAGDDLIYGGAGNDQVYGADGDDTLHGEAGVDAISGGLGNDKIYGGDGNDCLLGDLGEIALTVKSGRDEATVTLKESTGLDVIHGGNGDDMIYGQGGNDTLYGEGGNDSIDGGDGNDPIDGGEGDDRILGGNGDDPIQGGAGNDNIVGDVGNIVASGVNTVKGGHGNDTINGDAGDDKIFGCEGSDILHGDQGNDSIWGDFFNESDGGSSANVIYGDDDNDALYGAGGAEQFYGGSGNDVIRARGGDDTIYGGMGNDTVFGEAGNDILYGERGVDLLNGEAGDDHVYGGEDNDQLQGGDGNDRLFGEAGDDAIEGGAGDDYLEGGKGLDNLKGNTGNDVLYCYGSSPIGDDASADYAIGNEGNDRIYGADGGESLDGGAGEDLIRGGAGSDLLFGNFGNDELYGDTGDDHILGYDGSDLLFGGEGDDTLQGGEGEDSLHGESGNDTLSGNAGGDRMYGGDGNDLLYGDAVLATENSDTGDWMYGEGDDDVLYGQNGDDHMEGGAGVDELHGGSGNDTLLANDGVGDKLSGDSGDDWIVGSDEGLNIDNDFNNDIYQGDRIHGGLGNDTIISLGGADYIEGGEGDDHIEAGAGRDLVYAGAGNDWIYAGSGDVNSIYGEAGDDEIYGSDTGADKLYGGIGNDKLFGQGKSDQLFGGEGDDYLDGGADIDVINGDEGDDVLHGGGSRDILNGGDGDDILYGSDDGSDAIDGGDGNDRIMGYGGNDTITGGRGEDIIDGGPGDDTIQGDIAATAAGLGKVGWTDFIIGGLGNDVIYGLHENSRVSDDAVDSIYGDLGTNLGESGSGNDKIYGQGGNDMLFGEGGDDLIVTGSQIGGVTDYGSGESAVSADFVQPAPTPNPAVVGGTPLIIPSVALPNDIDYRGWWTELSGSASEWGVSGPSSVAIEPAIAVSADTQYIAWADGRDGNYEIYVACHDAGGWRQLGGSATGGGISHQDNSSRRPSITVDGSGQPIVSWTEYDRAVAGSSDIYAAQYDPSANNGAGGWVALGNSMSLSAISVSGDADNSTILHTASGPVVFYLDSHGGAPFVFAKYFNNGGWLSLGSGSATGTGISGLMAGVEDYAVTTDGVKIAVAWTQTLQGVTGIKFKEFKAGVWTSIGDSLTGGITQKYAGIRLAPTLAYFDNKLFAAWSDATTGVMEVVVKYYTGSSWSLAGGAPAQGGISQSQGHASSPVLASGGGALYLAWLNHASLQDPLSGSGLFVRKWNGSTFIDELPGDSSGAGVSSLIQYPVGLSLRVDDSGDPFVTWLENSTALPSVYALGHEFHPKTIYYVNDAVDANDRFTTAAGTAGSSGISPAAPSISLAALLTRRVLVAGDVVMLDAGVYSGDFSITAADAGFLVMGVFSQASELTGVVTLSTARDLVFQNLRFSRKIVVNAGVNVAFVHNRIAEINLNGADKAAIVHNDITVSNTELSFNPAISLQGAVSNLLVQRNVIRGGYAGIVVTQEGTQNVRILHNRFSDSSNGIEISSPATGWIAYNDVAAETTALQIEAAFTGPIEYNEFHHAAQGIIYQASAELSNNRIHHNQTGISAILSGDEPGPGFVGAAEPNDIYENTTGVSLSGSMRNQHIYSNHIGVTGSGVLGGDSLELANVIEHNWIGTQFLGRIQFNKIAYNQFGSLALNGQIINHNAYYRNMTAGVIVEGASEIKVINNTFYAPVGDNVRVQKGSGSVELFNNILWVAEGYDIYVEDGSRNGFVSDYNALYSAGSGKLLHLGNDFTDLLAIQLELDPIEAHSMGTTPLSAWEARPAFYDPAGNDFRVFAPLAGQFATSPTVDGGTSTANAVLTSQYQNQLINADFRLQGLGWTYNASGQFPLTSAFAASILSLDYYFSPGADTAGWIEQSVGVIEAGLTAQQIDSQGWMIIFGGNVWSSAEPVPDRGSIQITFKNEAGANIGTPVVQQADNGSERLILRVPMPAGTRSVTYRFQAVMVTGPENNCHLDNAFLHIVSQSSVPDLGAYENTSANVKPSTTPDIRLLAPQLYVDMEDNRQFAILWESQNNIANSTIRIDLYKDGEYGPAFLKTIASGVKDTGVYDWMPSKSGIKSATFGLRIQVQWETNQTVYDRSLETFTVPESGEKYYANDASTEGDEYATAVGDYRNTGKSPDAPKPNPALLLESYAVGAGQTIFVDTGNYRLLNPILISNARGEGDDEAFTMTGPVQAPHVASLNLIIPPANTPVIEIREADSVTLAHLLVVNGWRGIWVRQSSLFSANYVIAARNDQEGIRIDEDSSVAILDHLGAIFNGGHGLYIACPVSRLTNCEMTFNGGTGIYLVNPGQGAMEGCSSNTNRGDGIYINNYGNTALFIVGHETLSKAQGNKVSGNLGNGIQVVGSVAVTGNAVSGHNTDGTYAIDASGVARVSLNVVFNNDNGLHIMKARDIAPRLGATISESEPVKTDVTANRVYHNTSVGIESNCASDITQNVVYSNETGLVLMSGYSGLVSNNVVYANSSNGLLIQSDSSEVLVRNNTFYQTQGNAVQLGSRVENVDFRNNIVCCGGDYAVYSANTSAIQAFHGDYNLYYVTASAQIGVGAASLSDWRLATNGDGNSLQQAPKFVADTLFGYQDNVHDGRDDDFHLQSTAGSCHGGGFAPVLNPNSSLPMTIQGQWAFDVFQSPAIDRGGPQDAYDGEPSFNGGYVNIGAYGNTAQASKSPSSFVMVTMPDGGESYPRADTMIIRWRGSNVTGTVDLALVEAGAATHQELLKVTPIVSGTANDGEYAWTVSAAINPGNYRIRVTSGGLSDQSNGNIAITGEMAPQVTGVAVAGSVEALVSRATIQRSSISVIAVGFNTNVSNSLSAADLHLRNETTGQDISPSLFAVTFDASMNRAVFRIVDTRTPSLPDGNYRLTLKAAEIQNTAGTAMSADFSFDFHVLKGDVDANRATNDLDLFTVWLNQKRTAGTRSLNRDANGDQLFDVGDIASVKENYLKQLPSSIGVKSLGGSSMDRSPVSPITLQLSAVVNLNAGDDRSVSGCGYFSFDIDPCNRTGTLSPRLADEIFTVRFTISGDSYSDYLRGNVTVEGGGEYML